MANYNCSPELQMWVDLLNTPVSQPPPTPDKFGDASPLHRRSSASLTPCPQALSLNHLQLNRSIIPHTSIHRIHTLHLWSVVHWVEMLLHRIHTLHLQSVVHRVKMLLHRIHTLHPGWWFIG
jgi:hypothetical protein